MNSPTQETPALPMSANSPCTNRSADIPCLAVSEPTESCANDNDTENSEPAPEPVPSLYAALGYLPHCPYQWWMG